MILRVIVQVGHQVVELLVFRLPDDALVDDELDIDGQVGHIASDFLLLSSLYGLYYRRLVTGIDRLGFAAVVAQAEAHTHHGIEAPVAVVVASALGIVVIG